MIFFITGGSRGIGANLVEQAVAAGHDVAFTYRVKESEAQVVMERAKALRPGAKVSAYQLDVRNRQAVDDVVDKVLDTYDRIDVAIPNAGITRDALVAQMTDEDWDDVIGTNLTGAFYVCRAALPSMIGNRFGRIITISSVVAGGGSGQANYAASKAGLHGLTQTLAKEYGRRGITANAVVPGFFETEMTQQHMAEELKAYWRKYAPLPGGRVGELIELSNVIMFLASPQSGFINGQVINVTAGLDWTP